MKKIFLKFVINNRIDFFVANGALLNYLINEKINLDLKEADWEYLFGSISNLIKTNNKINQEDIKYVLLQKFWQYQLKLELSDSVVKKFFEHYPHNQSILYHIINTISFNTKKDLNQTFKLIIKNSIEYIESNKNKQKDSNNYEKLVSDYAFVALLVMKKNLNIEFEDLSLLYKTYNKSIEEIVKPHIHHFLNSNNDDVLYNAIEDIKKLEEKEFLLNNLNAQLVKLTNIQDNFEIKTLENVQSSFSEKNEVSNTSKRKIFKI